MNYTGAGDAFLTTAAKGLDFGTSDKMNISLKWRITNDSNADQLVILNPSYKPSTAARVVRDGVIPFEVGATTLVGAIDINTIAEALAWIAANPTEVLSVRITSNNPAQFSKSFKTISRKFGQPPVEKIYNFKKSRYQTQSDIIYMTDEIQLDNETELQVVVPAYVAEGTPTDTTFEFYYGASLSSSAAFANKKSMAMQDAGVRSLKAAQNQEK